MREGERKCKVLKIKLHWSLGFGRHVQPGLFG